MVADRVDRALENYLKGLDRHFQQSRNRHISDSVRSPVQTFNNSKILFFSKVIHFHLKANDHLTNSQFPKYNTSISIISDLINAKLNKSISSQHFKQSLQNLLNSKEINNARIINDILYHHLKIDYNVGYRKRIFSGTGGFVYILCENLHFDNVKQNFIQALGNQFSEDSKNIITSSSGGNIYIKFKSIDINSNTKHRKSLFI